MEKADDILSDLSVINVGLLDFAESLIVQKAKVVHVDWRPPAGGDEDLQKILDLLLG